MAKCQHGIYDTIIRSGKRILVCRFCGAEFPID